MKYLMFLVLIALLAQSVPASPLIFKSTKELTSAQNFVDICQLDTARFSRVRIQIVNAHEKVVSHSDFREFAVRLTAVEGPDEFPLLQTDAHIRYATVFDVPPTKLSIAIKGNGTFKVFVWAS